MGRFFAHTARQLELFVRQLAWLNTAPKLEGEKQAQPTRLKDRQDRKIAIVMPPNPAEYLTDWLFRIGPTVAGAMGEAPFRVSQIDAELRAIGIEADAWELETLRSLSKAWVSQKYEAEKPGCIEPVLADNQGRRRAEVSAKVKAMFGNRSKAAPPLPLNPRN